MAYDPAIAGRIRSALAERTDVEERSMFGGLAFMVRGHMCCGLVKGKMMVRLPPEDCDRLLGEPGAQPMDFTGRPMRGFLFVSGPALATPASLDSWVARAVEFAESQPTKRKTKR